MKKRRADIDGDERQFEDTVRVVPTTGVEWSRELRNRPPSFRLMLGILLTVAGLGGSFAYGFTIGSDREAATDASSAVLAEAWRRDRAILDSSPSTTEAILLSEAVPSTEAVLSSETISIRWLAPEHDVPDGATEFLNPNLISGVAVDPEGFIWSVGPGGVVRWDPTDGSSTRLTLPDGTGPVAASLIAVAETGESWVSSGDELWHWDGAEWLRGRYMSTGELEITALAAVGGGMVWVGTTDWGPVGLPHGRLNRGKGFFAGDIEALAVNGSIEEMSAASDGSVWALIEGDLWRSAGDNWTRVIDSFPGWIRNIASDPNGGVWFVNEAGLQYLDSHSSDPVPVNLRTPDGAQTRGNVQRVAVGSDGVPWVMMATWSEDGEITELVRVDDLTRHPSPAVGRTEPVVSPDGTVWFGTDEGLMGFDGDTWSTLRLPDMPPVPYVSSMAVDHDGILWVTGGADVWTWNGTSWTSHDPESLGWPDEDDDEWPPVWVAAGRDGTMWAFIDCRFLVRSEAKWVLLDEPEGIDGSACWLNGWAIGPDGSLWVLLDSIGGRYLYRHDGTAWSQGPRSDGRDFVGTLAVGDDGTVWGAASDIRILGSDGWTSVLGGVGVDSLAVAGDGSVWAAAQYWRGSSEDSAVWGFIDGVWTRNTSLAGVSRFVTAADGVIWAIARGANGREGVFRQRADGSFERVVTDSSLSLLIADADGGMWVGAAGRVLHLEP